MSRLLQELLADQAADGPNRTALVHGTTRMSYGELETLSNQIANALRAAGIRRGDRVPLLLPKSPAALAAMLGTLKADAMYVPLDPASPAVRLEKIVQAADARLILAAGPVGPLLEGLFSVPGYADAHAVAWLDEGPAPAFGREPEFTLADVQGGPAAPPAWRNSPADGAHILFTSGSTGTPKGVVVTHGSVLAFVRWGVQYFGLNSADRLSGYTPLHFDLSSFDIYGALSAGAELHLVPPELGMLPRQLAEFLRASRLTQWFSVPSVLNFMAKFDAVRQGDFPELRRLLWCGEVLPTPTLRYWMTRLPHITFTNLYGPTETAIASTYYTVPRCPEDDREAIPIGKPCAGEDVLLLDEELAPVPAGEIGEICIRGVGLSPGYWRDPVRTAQVFVELPGAGAPEGRIYRTGDLGRMDDNALLYFLGRKDSQIKSRGYRIELGEIEAALESLGTTRECAVVALPSEGFEGTAIGCGYVPAGPDLTPIALRQALSRLLPSYMLPARWLEFDQLPRNANGKIDRREIRERILGSVPTS